MIMSAAVEACRATRANTCSSLPDNANSIVVTTPLTA